MKSTPEALAQACRAILGDSVSEVTLSPQNQVWLTVPTSTLLPVMRILRDEETFQFNMLMDIAGIDYLDYGQSEWEIDKVTGQGFSRGVETVTPQNPQWPARFAVVYQLLSTVLNHRIAIKTFIPSDPLLVPSVISLWQSANWYEREAFDLFGILFDGHPDLRRILTDYGFVGHPFRKDFPLIGQVEMRYDAKQKRVLYEPVSIEPRTLVAKTIRPAAVLENAEKMPVT